MWIAYTRVKSNWAFVSRLISLFTKTKEQKFHNVPSHMQFVFDKMASLEAVGGTGVKIGFFPNSILGNEVIAVFNYKKAEEMGWKDSDLIIEGAFKYHGLRYDYKSIVWFLMYIARKWVTGKPVPSTNTWDNQNRFFCSEMMEFIQEGDFGSSDPNGQMLDLKTKPQMFELVFDKKIHGDFNDWFEPTRERLLEIKRKQDL